MMYAIASIPKKPNTLHIKKINTPAISNKEVLVKTIETGIDGTDIEIVEGLYGETPAKDNFLILGHESIGRILKTGSRVKNVKVGDIVIPTVRRECGKCINCNNNESDMCLTGKFTERGIKRAHGFLSEFYKEQPEYLVKIPKKLMKFAVLTEPLSIVEKAVSHIYKIQERTKWIPKKALVIGMGPLGILSCCLLRTKGLKVYAFARKQLTGFRKNVCNILGVEYFSTYRYDIPKIGKKTGKFDIIIEASGYSPYAFESINILNTNGVLCLTSITGGNTKLKINVDKLNIDMVLENKVIFGMVNSNIKHFNAAIKSFKLFNNKWPKLMEKFITRRANYENFKEAFIKTKDDVKVVVRFDNER